MKKKLINFWYYNKTMVIVLALALLGIGYMEFQYFRSEDPDYDIAIVSTQYYSEEQLEALKAAVSSCGADCNWDNTVITAVHTYRIELGSETADPETAGALDADLIGNVSGIFLLEDPAAFCEATNGGYTPTEELPVASTALSGLGFDGLYLYLRPDANEKYAAVLEALAAY